jgi:hypothetical protein
MDWLAVLSLLDDDGINGGIGNAYPWSHDSIIVMCRWPPYAFSPSLVKNLITFADDGHPSGMLTGRPLSLCHLRNFQVPPSLFSSLSLTISRPKLVCWCWLGCSADGHQKG